MNIRSHKLYRYVIFMSLCLGGRALNCFSCYAEGALEDCSAQQVTVSCHTNEVCYNATYNLYDAHELSYKGCVEKSKCHSWALCGKSEEYCEFECCDTDTCNSSLIVVPALYLVAVVSAVMTTKLIIYI